MKLEAGSRLGPYEITAQLGEGGQRLFDVPLASISGHSFDVTPDGERFLFLVPVREARPTPYTLILNWEQIPDEAR